MQQRVDRIFVIQVAAESKSDPRTVEKEIREPGSVRGLPGDRIRLVLRNRQPELALAFAPAIEAHGR